MRYISLYKSISLEYFVIRMWYIIFTTKTYITNAISKAALYHNSIGSLLYKIILAEL